MTRNLNQCGQNFPGRVRLCLFTLQTQSCLLAFYLAPVSEPSKPRSRQWLGWCLAYAIIVVQEFPFDTCRAITTVISSGLLLRHPNVNFLFAHNGGAFPYLADRIGAQHIDEIIAKNNNGMRLREILATKNIYFDTSISSSYQYPLLKELGIPAEHLLYATDLP